MCACMDDMFYKDAVVAERFVVDTVIKESLFPDKLWVHAFVHDNVVYKTNAPEML